jgi:type III pantothenate kinase
MQVAPPGLLTVDCGNSTIDCLWHDDGRRLRLPADVAAAALLAVLRERRVARCVAVRVVAGAARLLTEACAGERIPLAWAGQDLPCPLPLAYDTPATLGADRWLGALAAHRRFGRAIVVDCGTATTVNLVDADGTFRGGPIAPGLRALAAGMAALTPALPAPDLDGAPAMPSRSSASAVTTGVVLGYCGLVERLVADAIAVSRGSVQVLVTGGNAERLRRHCRLQLRHEPDLVHQGLLWLAAESEGPCCC